MSGQSGSEALDHRAAQALSHADRLLARAETDPTQAHPAAIEALRALLLFWTEEPLGETVSALLAQAAVADETLADLRLVAEDLDASRSELDAYERAATLVDAVRGRLMGD